MPRKFELTALLCAAAAVLAVSPVALAGSASKNPTKAEIKAAVAKAKRSSHLWATVNVCNTHKHPHTIGIRGQMPTLGFPARLSMLVVVDYWDPSHKRFLPDPHARRVVQLGVVSFGDEQGGRTFPFPAHSGLLRGTVTFAWRRSGKVLLSVTRNTSAGHKSADFSDPPGYSAAKCTIK